MKEITLFPNADNPSGDIRDINRRVADFVLNAISKSKGDNDTVVLTVLNSYYEITHITNIVKATLSGGVLVNDLVVKSKKLKEYPSEKRDETMILWEITVS